MADVVKATNKRVLFTAPLGQFGFYFYSNFVFQQMPMFLTDVAQFSANTAGVLDILKSLVRALFSTPAGMLIDKTKSRNGVNKYVPWLRWGSVLVSVCFVLIFSSSFFGMTPGSLVSKAFIIVFFFATYLSSQIFTAANLGFIPDITQDPTERSTLASMRSFMREAAKLSGGLYPSVLAYYTLKYNSEMMAYLPMGIVLAVIFVICAWICASEVKKFVPVKSTASGAGKEHKSISLKEQLKELGSNKALLILFFVSFFIMVRNMIDGPMATYYFKYVVQDFGKLSAFNVITKVASMIAIPAAPVLVNKLGTKPTMIISGMLLAFTQGITYFIDSRWKLYILLQSLGDCCHNICATVLEVLYANASDYGEWKNGHSIPSANMAIQTTAIQLATVAAVGIRTVIFNIIGYHAGIEPSRQLTKGIMFALSITFIPVIIGTLLSLTVPLGEKEMTVIRKDLADREEKFHQDDYSEEQ